MKICNNCGKNHNSNTKLCSRCYQKNKFQAIIESKRYVRLCPNCGIEIVYGSKYTFEKGVIKNSMCISCSGRKNIEAYRITHDNFKGENNPFFMKKHTEESINKIKNRDMSYTQTESFREMSSKRAKKLFEDPDERSKCNSFLNKSDEEIKTRKLKMSINASGENNPMFGRPSPQGSGNGWSGWYKDIYFRSILELSYIKYMMDNDIKFDNAEQRKYAIEYVDSITGNKRNYFPDFYLVESKKMVEIKPKKLINTVQNKDKYKYAKIKYKDNFIILTEEDIVRLTKTEIDDLYLKGDLVWIKRYNEKYLNRGF